METIASWIWNPVLSFLYIEIGLLILFLTGFLAWKKIWFFVPTLFKKKNSALKAHREQHARYISPWQGFFTALAASVGVGNLAGVGTAIHLGGPGALFWMWVSAIVGMSFRYCSTWMAMRYQPSDPKHRLYGTPMAYLEHFFKGKLRWIPAAFALFILMNGLITANLIQSNSVAHALQNEIDNSALIVAIVMATLVGFVILGGLRKIVDSCIMITPALIGLYVSAGIIVLVSDPIATANVFNLVFTHAFNPYSAAGGVVGYTVLQTIQFGISRGIFSHGSGLGLAPFLQASNSHPPQVNASFAALVTVIDTLIICTITGVVILLNGDWHTLNGALLTTTSFSATFGAFGKSLIIICLLVFSFTTIISWSYYAERCFQYLGGKKLLDFRWFFIAVTFAGPFFPVKLIWSIADILIALVLILHLFPLIYIVLVNKELLATRFLPIKAKLAKPD